MQRYVKRFNLEYNMLLFTHSSSSQLLKQTNSHTILLITHSTHQNPPCLHEFVNMSTKIAGLSSSYHFSCHERGSKTRASSILPMIKCGKNMYQTRDFFKFSAKYGISTVISRPGNLQVKASSSPNNPSSSSWKKWLMGILLTVILPAVGYKGGLFVFLKSKIDKAVETVEHVAEVVEEVAEKAEKLVEEVEEKLPTDSKLREKLQSFDDLAKTAVNEAKKAEDIIHKVKDVEEEIEKNIIKAGKDQPKM